MKKKDKQELRSKTVSQLEKELLEKEKALVEARIKLVKRQLKNTNVPRLLKVDIAVIRTIITEKLSEKENKNEIE